MLWKLDKLLNLALATKNKETTGDRKPSENPIPDDSGKEPFATKSDHPNSTGRSRDDDTEPYPSGEESCETPEVSSVEDVEMAQILGLEPTNLHDFQLLKSAYRKAIAQYHPDKVSAMGPEIRAIAEQKAKEINQAYHHLCKSFKM